jgi:hypothetical protein
MDLFSSPQFWQAETVGRGARWTDEVRNERGFGETAKAWPKSSRNKVRRYPARGSYDRPDIYKILDGALGCHVAYCIDGQPYCTPTAFWRDGDRLFWHGLRRAACCAHWAMRRPLA